LPTGPRRTVDVHPDVLLRDLDVVDLLDLGEHLDVSEGRLTPVLVVERRDAHQAVGALFDGKRAVEIGTADLESRRPDARFLGVRSEERRVGKEGSTRR